MLFNQLSASAVQLIARKILSLDPQAKNNLASFDNKIIQIQITDLNLVYYFSFKNGELLVSNELVNSPLTKDLLNKEQLNDEKNTNKVSAAINGKLSAFISAAASEHSSDSIFKGELNFSGDIATAKQFQNFVQNLNIDWHEPLAQVLGDPVAHTIATGLEKFSHWLGQTAESASQDMSEYVQEEAKVTPTQSEQQHFFQQVNQIRSQTDRLIARFNLIENSPKNKDTQ